MIKKTDIQPTEELHQGGLRESWAQEFLSLWNWGCITLPVVHGCVHKLGNFLNTIQLGSVWFSSVAQLCPTLCNPMNHNTPDLLSITNSRSLTKPSQVQPGPDVVEKMAEVLGSISHSWVVYLCDLTFLASVSYKCMSSMRWAIFIMGFPGTLVVKNLPANAGDIRDVGSIPGREDPLEEGMATHSSILAWRILWTEEPGRLQSIESQNWTRLKQLSTHMYLYSIFHL